MKWSKKKPKFDKECLLLTAVKIRGEWEFTVYIIKKIECDGKWYMGWLDGQGEEYGDLADLTSQLYMVLPLLK